jgi:hypothetical protein
MFELQLAKQSIQHYFQNLTPQPYCVEVYQWGSENILLVKFYIYHQYIGKLLVEDLNNLQEKIKKFLNLL